VVYQLPNGERLVQDLRDSPNIRAVSGRVITTGMIASVNSTAGVMIYGINPENEANLTGLPATLDTGTYFLEEERLPDILLSSKLASQLSVLLLDKVRLTFINKDGTIVAGAFRITGIFTTKSPRINNGVVYVQNQALEELLDMPGSVHEIALLAGDLDQVPALTDSLKSTHPEILVESWDQLAPEVALIQSQVKINLIIILSIIMLALAFGIVNTMLMAVLERIKEIGMLMAIGMNRRRIFLMVLFETFFLSCAGAPIGFFFGYLLVSYFQKVGINFSAFSEGLQEIGYDVIIYPEIPFSMYLIVIAGVFITALISSLYPARKAVKLKPVEALQKI